MLKKLRNYVVSVYPHIRSHPCVAAFSLCCVLGLTTTLPHNGGIGWFFVGLSGAAGILWVFLLLRDRLTGARSAALLWGMGVSMRLALILRSPYDLMQHDLGSFAEGKGHAGYMFYLMQEGHLPDFDVRMVSQFYHPPLHHLACAGWMRLMALLGLEGDALYESVQAVPFIWAGTALMVLILLFRELGVGYRAAALPTAILALHPELLILSGSLNNDMLSVLCMLSALLWSLRWYKEPSLRHILAAALSIGLGMSAKLSAWMAAPATGLLFLLVFLREKDRRGQLCGQFAAFFAVCIPTALWWGVRNLIGWGVPVTYIPSLRLTSRQYVGNHPIWERLFSLDPQQFSRVYDSFAMYGAPYNEYNPLVGLLKTAVFDEFVTPEEYPAVRGFGEVLFWSEVLLAAGVLLCMLLVLRRHWQRPECLALVVTYGLTLASYYAFCLSFPHVCTQSARYAVPVIYCSLLLLGMWQEEAEGRRAVRLKRGLGVAGGAFLAASFLIYGILLFRA